MNRSNFKKASRGKEIEQNGKRKSCDGLPETQIKAVKALSHWHTLA